MHLRRGAGCGARITGGVLGLHSLTEFNVNIKTYVLIYMKHLSYIILHSFDHAGTEAEIVSIPILRMIGFNGVCKCETFKSRAKKVQEVRLE